MSAASTDAGRAGLAVGALIGFVAQSTDGVEDWQLKIPRRAPVNPGRYSARYIATGPVSCRET
jgi:hypothetical protein